MKRQAKNWEKIFIKHILFQTYEKNKYNSTLGLMTWLKNGEKFEEIVHQERDMDVK